MRKILTILAAISLLCCGCSTSAPNGETQSRTEATEASEASERTLYEQIRQFIHDNNFKATYPEAVLEAVEKGENSYLQITTPDFAPVEVAEMEALAKEKGISVKAVSGNIYGIYGEYEDELWTLKGYYFDPEGAACREYSEPVDRNAAYELYEKQYKDYVPKKTTLTQLMVDACKMAYCVEAEETSSKYKFEGGYYFIKYYEEIKSLNAVKISDITPDTERKDFYQLCEYYTAPLDREKNAGESCERFIYLTGDLLVDRENYACTLYREGTVEDYVFVRNKYLSDAEEQELYALDAKIKNVRGNSGKIQVNVNSEEYLFAKIKEKSIRENLKTIYYAWNFITPGRWLGVTREIVEAENRVSFLYGDITRLVWDKKTDEVWIERDTVTENADKYVGKYLSGSKNVVHGSNMVISKEGGNYHIEVLFINAANCVLDGYEKDGKLILTGMDGGSFYMEAEITKGENDNLLIFRILKKSLGWGEEGEEIEFYRL